MIHEEISIAGTYGAEMTPSSPDIITDTLFNI